MKIKSKPLAVASLFFAFSLLQFCHQSEPRNAADSTAQTENAPAPSPGRPGFAKKSSPNATADAKDSGGEKPEEPLDPFQTEVAAAGKIDSLKKFVRTADLKFRVADVLRSTLEIEKVAVKNGGFVTQSDLTNRYFNKKIVSLNRDSSLETMTTEPECQITLRVPFHLLDTTLREIGKQCELMDFRNVKAEDIGLQMLENQLVALRQKIYEQQVSSIAESESARSASRLEAAERGLQSRAATDQSRLDNLKIEDKIRFSTVVLKIYQLPQVRQQVIANVQNQVAKPPFGRRFAESLTVGWQFVETLLLGVFTLWPLVLLGFGFWFVVRRRSSAVLAK